MSEIYPSVFSLRFAPHRLTGAIDWHGHLCFAAWLMELARPRTLVELGVFRGDSLAAFAQAARELRLECAITGIDTWKGDETTGRYGDEVYEEVKHYFDTNHPGVAIVRETFDGALHLFDDDRVDLLHIDGCHHYEAVKHDYESWKPKLSERGIVILHDVSVVGNEFGTRRFWEEIKDSHLSFSFTHSNGLGVLLCGPEQPHALKTLATDPELLDVVRAVCEVTGAKFFHLAKEKWWQNEAVRHASSLSQIGGDIGKQIARQILRRLGPPQDTPSPVPSGGSTARHLLGTLLSRFGRR